MDQSELRSKLIINLEPQSLDQYIMIDQVISDLQKLERERCINLAQDLIEEYAQISSRGLTDTRAIHGAAAAQTIIDRIKNLI